MTTPIDIRTASQKEKDARHKRVCDMYLDLLGKFPEATPSRLFAVIANETSMSHVGVRNIIIENGLYQVKNPKI